MRRLSASLDDMPRERLAELVSAAGYGTVLVLAALSVVGVSDVAGGHGVELVAGVGVATWLAHLFAEILGGHVEHATPRGRDEIARAAVDGSPILAATVLPALMLLLGRLDVLPDTAARVIAILLAIVQLFAIGAVVARVAPAPPATRWAFAASTASVGLVIVVLTVALGH
jgi:hypothetical protein